MRLHPRPPRGEGQASAPFERSNFRRTPFAALHLRGATSSGATNPGTKTSATSNSVPWLAIIILAVVVLLGILGYFLFRSRRTASPALIGGGTTPAPRMPA